MSLIILLPSPQRQPSKLSTPEYTVELKGASLSWAPKDKSSKKNVLEVRDWLGKGACESHYRQGPGVGAHGNEGWSSQDSKTRLPRVGTSDSCHLKSLTWEQSGEAGLWESRPPPEWLSSAQPETMDSDFCCHCDGLSQEPAFTGRNPDSEFLLGSHQIKQ